MWKVEMFSSLSLFTNFNKQFINYFYLNFLHTLLSFFYYPVDLLILEKKCSDFHINIINNNNNLDSSKYHLTGTKQLCYANTGSYHLATLKLGFSKLFANQ